MLAAVALGATLQGSRPAPLEGVTRIVMMGDSITQIGGTRSGYVTLVKQSLAAALGAKTVQVINAGVSGQKATDMHARFQKDVIDQRPQLLTLSVGVNDVWHDFRNPEWTARVASGDSGRGVKLPVYEREVEAMVREAQKAGIKVCLLSPTLVYEDLDCAENKRLSQYVQAEKRISQRTGAFFVDLNKGFRDAVAAYQKHAGKRTLLLTVDGVHLNDAGNALMADMILKSWGIPIEDHLTPH